MITESEGHSLHPEEEVVLSPNKKSQRKLKHILFRFSVKEREEAFLHSLEIN